MFVAGGPQKLVWVSPEKLHLEVGPWRFGGIWEVSPLQTHAGKQWITRPLKHLAHHSFKRAANGGFMSVWDGLAVVVESSGTCSGSRDALGW